MQRADAARGGGKVTGVKVKEDERAAGPNAASESFGVSAKARGAIENDIARLRSEEFKNFPEQDGDMGSRLRLSCAGAFHCAG